MIFYNGVGRGFLEAPKYAILLLIPIAAILTACGPGKPATACQRITPALNLALDAQGTMDHRREEGWITGPYHQELLLLVKEAHGTPLYKPAEQYARDNTPANHRLGIKWLREYWQLRTALIRQARTCHVTTLLTLRNPWPSLPKEPKYPVGRVPHYHHKPKPSPQAVPTLAPQAPVPSPETSAPPSAAKPDEHCTTLGATAVYYTPAEHHRDLLTCEHHVTSGGTAEQVWIITGH